jgi:hypothetical protein
VGCVPPLLPPGGQMIPRALKCLAKTFGASIREECVRFEKMISIASLTPADIGTWVLYRNKEPGRIKSWNDTYIFVVYHPAKDWLSWEKYDALATYPQDLIFLRGLNPEDIAAFFQ